MKISKENFEYHRKGWSEVAKKNGWYYEPFYIQVWVNRQGNIVNSVAIRGLSKDYVLREDDDTEITDFELV